MKIIEGMKEIKDLAQKRDDLIKKVTDHAAIMDFETPTYTDQKAQIDSWLQSVADINKRILEIRISIQRTNLQTMVPIQLNGSTVNKTIAEWVHRRRDLAGEDKKVWEALNIKERTGRVKDGQMPTSMAGQVRDVKILRYYDPKTRDEKMALYQSEPSKIDATLEVVNAVTDLV
jgi:hypothetical protein